MSDNRKRNNLQRPPTSKSSRSSFGNYSNWIKPISTSAFIVSYRQRHAEIAEFLDKHLEKTVREALKVTATCNKRNSRRILQKAEQAAQSRGHSAGTVAACHGG